MAVADYDGPQNITHDNASYHQQYALCSPSAGCTLLFKAFLVNLARLAGQEQKNGIFRGGEAAGRNLLPSMSTEPGNKKERGAHG